MRQEKTTEVTKKGYEATKHALTKNSDEKKKNEYFGSDQLTPSPGK